MVGGKDRPIDPPVMKKVTVETFGITYQEQNKLKNKYFILVKNIKIF